PVPPGFLELASAGYESSLAPANHDRATSLIAADSALQRDSRWAALFDPQTAGGLLLAVPEDQASALLARLRGADCQAAAVIGEVTPRGTHPMLQIEP
ncbi:MAG: hypothetical protein EHM42_14875, partial [Planctomycetaceae bacterium]